MRLTFIGADHEVTGSCHYLECGETKLLVDCGMEQGVNVYSDQLRTDRLCASDPRPR